MKITLVAGAFTVGLLGAAYVATQHLPQLAALASHPEIAARMLADNTGLFNGGNPNGQKQASLQVAGSMQLAAGDSSGLFNGGNAKAG